MMNEANLLRVSEYGYMWPGYENAQCIAGTATKKRAKNGFTVRMPVTITRLELQRLELLESAIKKIIICSSLVMSIVLLASKSYGTREERTEL